MPYTQATLLELMRYHSLVPVPGPRSTTCTTVISGMTIPENTTLLLNIWGVHHDREFWIDPENFRPERFLGHSRYLLSPDHPKRRRVLAFSSGIRGCPAEQFDMNRLFLWLANTCKRFRVSPGTHNTLDSVRVDALQHNFLMYPPSCKLVFKKRNSIQEKKRSC